MQPHWAIAGEEEELYLLFINEMENAGIGPLAWHPTTTTDRIDETEIYNFDTFIISNESRV